MEWKMSDETPEKPLSPRALMYRDVYGHLRPVLPESLFHLTERKGLGVLHLGPGWYSDAGVMTILSRADRSFDWDEIMPHAERLAKLEARAKKAKGQ